MSKKAVGTPETGVNKAPTGSRRRTAKPSFSAQQEHDLAVAEEKGLSVFRGVTVMMVEAQQEIFADDYTIGVVVSRDSTFSQFVERAIENIKKEMTKNAIAIPDNHFQNISFVYGPNNITPSAETTMMQLEAEHKSAHWDGIIVMKYSV